MPFIDAFLGLCSAVGAGSATEIAEAGYARQAISFGDPVDGVSFSTVAYSFGQALRAGPVGRAIFDAPTGGHLLLVLPFPTPLSRWRLPWDSGEPGYLRLAFTALAAYPSGGAYVGSSSDANDIVNPVDISVNIANPAPLINLATMTTGVALSITRGVLAAA